MMLLRKKLIRRHYLNERLKLSSDEVLRRSKDVQNRFLELEEFKVSKKLALYASFKNEVLTDKIFHSSLRLGKRLFYPKISIIDKKKELVFYEVSKKEELSIGSYDILEPSGEENVHISSFDLIVVPGVAFDVHGNRIGYGKGYYDKALAKLDNNRCVVGLTYGFQVIPEIPVLPHDIKVNKIVTEEKVFIAAFLKDEVSTN